MDSEPLTHRALAMLRAVGHGRAELSASREPDLRVDGLLCCDQATTRLLVRAGFLRAAHPPSPGQWTRAELTTAGAELLASAQPSPVPPMSSAGRFVSR